MTGRIPGCSTRQPTPTRTWHASFCASWRAAFWAGGDGGDGLAPSFAQVDDANWGAKEGDWRKRFETFKAERVYFSISSEHADGKRRGPMSISEYLKTRLAETVPMLPSDPTKPPSALAVGMP